MRSRFIYALPSLVLASAAIGLAIYGLLSTQNAEQSSLTEAAKLVEDSESRESELKSSYVIATRTLNAGDTLDPESVSTIETAAVIETAVSASNLSYDQPLERQFKAGEILTTDFFEPATRLQPLVTEGKRALALDLTPLTSVGGLVLPGDYLDIYGSFRGVADDEAVTVEILSQVEVLAVQGSTDPAEEQSNDNQRRNQTLVLSVPRDDVARILLAASESRLSFVASASDMADEPQLKEEIHRLAFLNDIRPIREQPEEDPQAMAGEQKEQSETPEGRQIQIFEGSTTRSVYVQ
ncbi:MAG: Flp pilus assembly protein CpaB [Marinobacter excellens HL-55]|uniref:Flp pilus assembly protein CpaB n=1 Tax=Marinobacter excellens HL-55 TaxID=1305731 RepID=A0A0N8KKV0_9GAMM|nr:MAG: Flp pilus assembly protein CpaB [Marinobacter excellens HL-55]